MNASPWSWRAGLAALLYLGLLLPPASHVLVGSMTLQMLVQIPLLVVAGYLLRGAVPRRFEAIGDRWNHQGVSGLVLATLAGMFWMLPRSLDAAVSEPWMAAAKLVSVPLLVGLPMGLSWPRMGFIVRGVFLLELIATFYRLGWLYLVSPQRLCSNFLLDDQQRSGRCMLMIGTVVLLYVAGKLMWGRFDASGQAGEPGGMPPGAPLPVRRATQRRSTAATGPSPAISVKRAERVAVESPPTNTS